LQFKKKIQSKITTTNLFRLIPNNPTLPNICCFWLNQHSRDSHNFVVWVNILNKLLYVGFVSFECKAWTFDKIKETTIISHYRCSTVNPISLLLDNTNSFHRCNSNKPFAQIFGILFCKCDKNKTQKFKFKLFFLFKNKYYFIAQIQKRKKRKIACKWILKRFPIRSFDIKNKQNPTLRWSSLSIFFLIGNIQFLANLFF
jgi:hypothetical protein